MDRLTLQQGFTAILNINIKFLIFPIKTSTYAPKNVVVYLPQKIQVVKVMGNSYLTFNYTTAGQQLPGSRA